MKILKNVILSLFLFGLSSSVMSMEDKASSHDRVGTIIHPLRPEHPLAPPLGRLVNPFTTQMGNNTTASRPFVSGDYIYFQGTDNKLWKMNVSGIEQINLVDGNVTPFPLESFEIASPFGAASSPFISGEYAYFQGTDNILWKININGTGLINLGYHPIASRPFVSGGYAYFQGTDNKLWKINSEMGLMSVGGNQTACSPFVSGDYIYFQGIGEHDRRLWKVKTDGSGLVNLRGNQTASKPFVYGEYVYYQGNGDNNLWKVKIDGTEDAIHIGGNQTGCSPFVSGDYVYFQGNGEHDRRLWKVKTDGSGLVNLRGNHTASTPFVYGEYVYYQGVGDNNLWKVKIDNTEDAIHIGGNQTACSPFVYDDYVYFQGNGEHDHRLWKVKIDGTGLVNLGGNQTASTPFVSGDYVYFQGNGDNNLWKVKTDGTGLVSLGDYKTASTPFVSGGYVYFQGVGDSNLWKLDSSMELINVGDNQTSCSPFVYDDYVYFQGNGEHDRRLWKVKTDGSGLVNLRGNQTASTPFVYGDYVYFQGVGDNNLWKVKTDGTEDTIHIGGNQTGCSPFVYDDDVYFQGNGEHDHRLWKVKIDGTGLVNLGGNQTASTPFVYGDYVYFQGNGDNNLWRVKTDGTGLASLGGNKTASTPFVSGDYVYFRGTDNTLWKINTGMELINVGGNQTGCSPFVSGDYIYFQGNGGHDRRLWKVKTDGSGLVNLRGNQTASTPFVYGEYVYYQGVGDNNLWKVKIDNTEDAIHIGGNQTGCSPFVSGDYVYFQGNGEHDRRLWKVKTDGSGLVNLRGNHTASTPFVYGDYVYFQGVGDNNLWKVKIDNTEDAIHIGGNQTACSPFVYDDYVYFQGNGEHDHRLWKVKIDGTGLTNVGNNQTGSTPFISGDYVYFQGNGDNKLWRVGTSSDWMQRNLAVFGEMALHDMCIPGSHDAGMSSVHDGTAAATWKDTQTQSLGIRGQLEFGVRYFDIRPVIGGGGGYWTGHYSNTTGITWQGARGQSIESIIEDINVYTSYNKELIILNLSHDLNTTVGNNSYRPFYTDEWHPLFTELQHLTALVPFDNTCQDLTSYKLSSFIGGDKAAVVVIVQPGNEDAPWPVMPARGFFRYRSFNVYNAYANTNKFYDMQSDQIRKMITQESLSPPPPFLLSWTLTEDGLQAFDNSTLNMPIDLISGGFSGVVESIVGFFEGDSSDHETILHLADVANSRLSEILPTCTSRFFPNVLYIDNVVSYAAAVSSFRINRSRISSTLTLE